MYDQSLWEHLVQKVDHHFSIKPDSNGQVHLPGDFIPFPPDITASDGPHPWTPIQQLPAQVNPNDDTNNPGTAVAPIPIPPPPPILSQHMSHTLITLALTPVSTPVPSTVFQPRCSVKSNFGQASNGLDPSNYHATQHINVTDYSSSPIKHFTN